MENLSSDIEDGENPVIRPYECNFCRRGFSNAQALGGHMNIHRRDKAKLKQQRHFQNPPSSHYDNYTLQHHPKFQLYPTTPPTQPSPKWPPLFYLGEENDDDDDDHAAVDYCSGHGGDNVRQLSLFGEKPSRSRGLYHHQHELEQVHWNNERISLSGSSSGFELDLELRLGPSSLIRSQRHKRRVSIKNFF